MSIWGNTVGGNKPLDEINDRLLKTGGTMTGNIAMSGNMVTGLGSPEEDADAANKGYVDKKHLMFSATLTVNGWEGDTAPYTQTVGIEGILEDDNPHVFPVYDADADTRMDQREAWILVCDGKTEDGSITFTCDEDKPAVAIPVQIEVNR